MEGELDPSRLRFPTWARKGGARSAEWLEVGETEIQRLRQRQQRFNSCLTWVCPDLVRPGCLLVLGWCGEYVYVHVHVHVHVHGHGHGHGHVYGVCAWAWTHLGWVGGSA